MNRTEPDRAAGQDRTEGQERSTLSPREAARIAQVGKSTIMRAIEAGQLEARRDNRNQWRIEREALDRWTADRPGPNRDIPELNRDRTGAPHGTVPDHLSAAAQELAEARAQAAEAQSRADQLEARLDERAALVRMAEDRAQAAEAARISAETRAQAAETLAAKLTDILAARPADPPADLPRRGWRWPWS